MAKQAKNTICLWYNGEAEDAARFYAKTFRDSSVGAVHRAPGDFPSGKKGDVLMGESTVMGIPCLGLNGGPALKHNEALTATRRARVAGARANGDCPGRLRQSS
jgi:predicted 3-demethylubiquinone-9 3-methyltransferase (glyoxalase superfamily)